VSAVCWLKENEDPLGALAWPDLPHSWHLLAVFPGPLASETLEVSTTCSDFGFPS
jgi:hypothetical protein